MTVTIPTRQIENTKDVYRKELGHKESLEDLQERYIKSELRIEE